MTATQAEIPSPIHFEHTVLASLMVYGAEAAVEIPETGLKSADFLHDPTRELYLLLLKRIDEGLPVDAKTLVESLSRTDLGRYGGATHVELALPLSASMAHLHHAARTVRALAMLRRARKLGLWGADRASASIPGGDIVAYAEQMIGKFEEFVGKLRDASSTPSFRPVGHHADQWLDQLDRKEAGEVVEIRVSTGLDELDRVTNGGLYPTDLIVFGGRAAMGKTSTGMSVGYNVANSGYGVGIVSIEQPSLQVTCKLASVDSGVPYAAFRSQDFNSTDQRNNAVAAMRRVGQMPILVNEAAYKWSDIRSQIRRLKLTMARTATPLRFVMIDYLGLMENDDAEGKNRQESLDLMINSAKRLAKEIKVPIAMLVQVNREAVKGKTTRPEIHHLRGSGGIENACDVVVLIHRENYYDKAQPEGEATLIVAKNRHGETLDLTMSWDGATGTVANMEFRSPVAPHHNSGGYR
jgi:replicative DNA helicase